MAIASLIICDGSGINIALCTGLFMLYSVLLKNDIIWYLPFSPPARKDLLSLPMSTLEIQPRNRLLSSMILALPSKSIFQMISLELSSPETSLVPSGLNFILRIKLIYILLGDFIIHFHSINPFKALKRNKIIFIMSIC